MSSITANAPTKGYTKKPAWIYALGISFILAPFGNFLWSLAALGERWWHPQVWQIWVPYIEWYVWLLMVSVSVSGVALLIVRRWSWILAMTSLALVMVYSLIILPNISSKASIGIVVLLLVLTIGALGAIFYSPFRLPYLNPRLRWWETSPRYRVDINARISGVDAECTLVDVSRTGALIEWSSGKFPELSERAKLDLPMGLSLVVDVARKTERGYGLRFVSSANKAEQKNLKIFLKQLANDPSKLQRK